MAPISPGFQLGRSGRAKKSTAPANLHRFEPFTKRIARLKIDPVHNVERRKPSDDDSNTLQSFFRASLEEWAELNLSQTFTSFLNKVNPLCENLPQLIHHENTIFDLLVQHIERDDALALEPLLNLLAHLAHDLGRGFERHFSRTVELVAQIASSHEQADVIEWCFTCLTWMFKYLSRLLVQDLRPLLNIMTPYLSSKKDYVVRFSAESLAFLLRKAAILYQKNAAPLTLALEHLLQGVTREEASAPTVAYRLGIMSLCVESARGIDEQLHSCSESLLQCLLETSLNMSELEAVCSTVEGIFIALIHETRHEGFQPALEVVQNIVRQCAFSGERNQGIFALRLCTVVFGTRKGSRISAWPAAIGTFLALAGSLHLTDREEPSINHLLALSIAEILVFAPVDQLLPFSARLLDLAMDRFSTVEFLALAKLCAELSENRFMDLVLPRLQGYVSKNWSHDQVGFYYLLESLRRDNQASSRAGDTSPIGCPVDLESSVTRQIQTELSTWGSSSVEQLAGHLRLAKLFTMPSNSSTSTMLLAGYHDLVTKALKEAGNEPDLRRRLVLGWGFENYIELASDHDSSLKRLASLALSTSPVLFRMPSFLRAVIRLIHKFPALEDLETRGLETVRSCLVHNLLSGSQSLKTDSLSLLRLLTVPAVRSWLDETTDVMLEILHTPYTPSEARKIAMLLRRLPQQQRRIERESTVHDLIPYFCLGLLSQYHEQTRKEVCSVLADMVEAPSVEETVVNVALDWLQIAPGSVVAPQNPQQTNAKMSSFECASLDQVRTLCHTAFADFQCSNEKLHSFVEEAHRVEVTGATENGRGLALQVLLAIPASAERRSRLVVPVFLAAPMNRGQLNLKHSSDVSTSSHTLSPELDDQEWSLTDRKALLSLFGKFKNPRVLFRSLDVHQKLIDLLSNGNLELRKLSLLAILTWKDPVLARHEAALLELADDKSTHTQIGAILGSEVGDGSITAEDRPTILPVILRLIFGLIVGRAGTSGSQEARRKALLRLLFRLNENEVTMFLDIALGKLRDVKVGPAAASLTTVERGFVPDDQQYGFLRLLLSLLETLESDFAPYGPQVVDAVVFCTINASQQSNAVPVPAGSTAPLSRNIRRTGFQCLVLLFENCPSVDWPRYLPDLFTNAISPRLEIFASETSQGISVLLRLFGTWARSHDHVGYLSGYDKRAPQILWQCLIGESVQKEVKAYILQELVVPWVTLAEDKTIAPNTAHGLLKNESKGLLTALMALLERTPATNILAAVTLILPKLAVFAESKESRLSATKLLARILGDRTLKFPPNVKSQLIRSIDGFLTAEEEFMDDASRLGLYGLMSSLFNYFKDEANRQILCQILERLSSSDESLEKAARLSGDLNAVSTQRLEEIDYDRRLKGFQAIQEMKIDELDALSWQPIVYNLLFFVRATADFTIRSNATVCLKRLLVAACQADEPALNDFIATTVVPVTKKCIKAESEHVRSDFVSILGLLVQHFPHDLDLANLSPLLVGNDEEASFFSNILHIQQHRRLRAIRRLISEVEQGVISARNNAEIFVPLLELFIQDPSKDESAQSAKGQSVTAMGVILQWIDWAHFKRLFHRYRSGVEVTDGDQKTSSRLLGHAADALLSARSHRSDNSDALGHQSLSHLATSLPEDSVVERELRSQFIPKLAELIHYKDEAEISLRLPVAVTTMKLVTLLPPEEVSVVGAPVILDIAHILRSRSQDSRNVAREALCQITSLLGPSSLQFVLKEMRTALTRGYHLHVVSYTLHAILVAMTPTAQQGDLDYCGEDIVAVIVEDIFGAVGQEKDNQDYISSMKEVKSNKSYDSMELLARSISVSSGSKLVMPLQTLLTGPLNSKQVRQVDELLRRIGIGLSQNPAAKERDILTFAYQLMQSLYQQGPGGQTRASTTKEEKSRQRYLIQHSTNRATNSQSSTLLYKLARFALDLVRSTFLKHGDLLVAENVHGFLPIIGDALVEGLEDVKISALRLLSAIIKLPMHEIEENAPLYVNEAVKVVKNSTNTNEEGAQAALKFVSAVLRERRSVDVRDADIAELLHRISPDIEEPDRQGVTFNFIRAVMSRKLQLPEIYELADKIGIMMVTNQSKGSRDVARGVYVHFLLEYPQSTARWTKQQKFLMRNLEYEHPEGRQSVMEGINTLVGKLKGEAAQELISMFYIPILLRMSSDDNKVCRELAGALLGRIFSLADRARLGEMFVPLRSWMEQEENQALQTLGMQAYGILLDTDVVLTREEVLELVESLAKGLGGPSDGEGDDWERHYHSLSLLLKLTRSHPEATNHRQRGMLWSRVWGLLGYPHAWVQSTSASLVQEFFRLCGSTGLGKQPLTCATGLAMESRHFLDILRAGVRILRRTESNEDLSVQIVQVLLVMGRCLDMDGLTMEVADKNPNDGEDVEDEAVEDDDAVDTSSIRRKSIPAIQYLFDQITRILRVETWPLSSAALLPKRSSLTLLSNLVPELSAANLSQQRVHEILLPLQHLTDPNTVPPRSADPAFSSAYQSLVEVSHEVMEKLQIKLGDSGYVAALTEVSKTVRQRREARRTKRRIERVAEPEKASRDKKRKGDRKRERKKELGRAHQKRREMGS